MMLLGIIALIIIVGVCLVIGYGLLLEYLTEKEMRPIYHIFIIIFAIMILSATCSHG